MDEVIPFRPRRVPQAPPPVPPEHQHLHRRARQATPGARDLAARQNAELLAGYRSAQAKQQNDRLVATGRIVPARITIALDLRGLEGPEVDIACGAQEPDVDLWECGIGAPNDEQLRLLAELTGFLVPWFYRPIPPGPLLGGNGRMWICGKGGCESPEPDYVDEQGVLHYGGEPPRTPPAAFQGPLFHTEQPTPPTNAATPAKARSKAAPRRQAPATGEQLDIPPGRLSDEDRAALRARIEQARKKFH